MVTQFDLSTTMSEYRVFWDKAGNWDKVQFELLYLRREVQHLKVENGRLNKLVCDLLDNRYGPKELFETYMPTLATWLERRANVTSSENGE